LIPGLVPGTPIEATGASFLTGIPACFCFKLWTLKEAGCVKVPRFARCWGGTDHDGALSVDDGSLLLMSPAFWTKPGLLSF